MISSEMTAQSATKTKGTHIMNRHAALLLGLYVVSVAVILLATYPTTDNHDLFTRRRTIAVYAEMTGCISLLGIFTWLLMDRLFRRRVYIKAALAFFATAFLLGGYGLFMFNAPPASKDVFLVDMQALFFKDYMGLKFTWVTGPLCSLVLAVMIIVNGKYIRRF